MWKQQLAKSVRLGFLLFVLLVFAGLGSQRHLIAGADLSDITLAMVCVIAAISPVFITMGTLMADDDSEACCRQG